MFHNQDYPDPSGCDGKTYYQLFTVLQFFNQQRPGSWARVLKRKCRQNADINWLGTQQQG